MYSTVARWFLLSRRELAALTIVFVVSLPAVTPRLYSSDEVQYFSYLRSLWFDRDVSFENEYRYFNERDMAGTPGFRETFLVRATPAGRRINFGTIGAAILWAPFYGVADIVVRTRGSAPAEGYSRPYVRAVAYGSAFYGFLAVLLSIRAARRVLGPGDGAVLAGVVIWFGTPLLFYMYVAPPFAHACSAFAVALFVTVWLEVRRTWTVRGAIVLGLSGALMAMVREQDVFFALGPAVDLGHAMLKPAALSRHRAAQLLASGIAAIAAFAVGVLPQVIAYYSLNGRPGPSQLVTRKMLWHAPHALKVLASPEHGFLIWTPLALLGIVGLGLLAVRGTGEARRVAGIALLMFGLQVYVNGSVDSWSAAGAFGHRRFVALTVLLVIGLSALWRWTIVVHSSHVWPSTPGPRVGRSFWVVRGRAFTTTQAALLGAIVLSVWWNVALIALFATRMMDRQRIELARNAYDAFVTLPARAPSLVYRYLADRESFYRSRAPEQP